MARIPIRQTRVSPVHVSFASAKMQNKRTRAALPSATAATTSKNMTARSAKRFTGVAPPVIDRGAVAAMINLGVESPKLASYISAVLASATTA